MLKQSLSKQTHPHCTLWFHESCHLLLNFWFYLFRDELRHNLYDRSHFHKVLFLGPLKSEEYKNTLCKNSENMRCGKQGKSYFRRVISIWELLTGSTSALQRPSSIFNFQLNITRHLWQMFSFLGYLHKSSCSVVTWKRATDSSLCNFVNKRNVHHVPRNIGHLQSEKTDETCRIARTFINTCRIRCFVYFRGCLPAFHTEFLKRKRSFTSAISQRDASMKHVWTKQLFSQS